METRQRRALYVGLTLVALVSLVPPWEVKQVDGNPYRRGHAPVFSPPATRFLGANPSVAWGSLFLYWIVIAAMTTVAIVALKSETKR